MSALRRAIPAACLLLTSVIAPRSFAQDQGPVAQWSFDQARPNTTHDSAGAIDDKLEGFTAYVPGITGTALRFDGYTTGIVRDGKSAPRLKNAFTVEAWVALNTYPWNLVPIVDHQADQQVGYQFGIDPLGHVALGVSIDRVWRTVTTTAQLPLKKWVHLVGVFDSTSGLTIFIDGKPAGNLDIHGDMSPLADAWYGQDDLLIGRVRQPMVPVPSERDNPKFAVMYSLDGLLDEVKIYNRGLRPEEVQKDFASAHAPAGEVLPWPALPAGPSGPGPFGAYYTTLKYEDVWDRQRRLGPDSDVIVRFDQSPIRLVFWQGTNYIPAWVTENNKWYTDEFLETYGTGCPDGGDCEPMSDKQSRYSHVRILESNNARAIVHWRYALSEVEYYHGANPDAMGWFDWADEYWTVYPDGVAIRRQVLWTSDVSKPHEWQESIVIHAAGQRPEDNINLEAITLANMQGQTATYTWPLKKKWEFTFPEGPRTFDKPDHPNIQIVNLKANWKPFAVIPPEHAKIEVYNQEKTFYTFECWNHWPVAQIVSSGRPCVAPDRPSHSSLSHLFWDTYKTGEGMQSKILMSGLTSSPITELLPIAKAWLSPAKLEVAGTGLQSDGYDAAERAYILSRPESRGPSEVELTLEGSPQTPIVNPAFVVKNWGNGVPSLKVDGKPVAWGADYRYGLVPDLKGTKLVLWIQTQSTHPLKLSLIAQKEQNKGLKR
ncbi:MAG TPA: LamG domain-containing protein [Terracidiphilus sp.]